MPYTKTVWVNGTAPAINDTNLNKIEQGIFDSLRQDGTTSMSAQLITVAGSAAIPAIAPTGDSDTGILFPAAGRISLTSNGTEVVYCHSNLNVAIGHNAPTSKLDVAGAIAARGAALAGAFFTISPDATTGTNGTTIANSFASGGYGPLYIQNGGSTRLTVLSNGNVGIGETNPQTELHITGTGEIARIESTTARGSGSNYLSFYDPTGVKANFGFPNADDNFWFINSLNGDMNFGTNNTNRMKIEAGGTVRPHANNTYDLGSSSFRWATIYAQNALNVSDARLKTDVQDSTLGLDFISNLRPVQYKFIEGRNEVTKDGEGNDVVTPIAGVRTHFGLIAQEVKSALPSDLDFAGWCLADKNDTDSTQSLGYTELIAPMIKAIQELTEKVEALEAQLKA